MLQQATHLQQNGSCGSHREREETDTVQAISVSSHLLSYEALIHHFKKPIPPTILVDASSVGSRILRSIHGILYSPTSFRFRYQQNLFTSRANGRRSKLFILLHYRPHPPPTAQLLDPKSLTPRILAAAPTRCPPPPPPGLDDVGVRWERP